MLPVSDDNSQRRITPLVTYGLIALNVLFFIAELMLGENFIVTWAFVPARFLANPIAESVTLITSMFMHADYLHIGSNMLYLWIFGDNVEDRFGHGKFAVFYLVTGLAATFAQMAFNLDSNIPNLGASGAIAGVLGAYLVLFPQGKVYVAQGRGIMPVPALIAIGLWFVLQVFSGIGSLGVEGGGVAYMAHIGGFVAGFVLAYVLGGRNKLQLRG
ncbi:MAG: rhomboid family intramembrane serine protease [Anaerolineae bacterium]|nr:MAG: rhomboid family intramembrane serine protease [Anaerolineae bacterium]